MADRPLVLVPHEHMHAPRSIMEQARKLGPDVTEMALAWQNDPAHMSSILVRNRPISLIWLQWETAWLAALLLLNGQSLGTKSELHQSPELTDAHWQLIVGLTPQITRPAKPRVICAKLCPPGRGSPG